MAISTLLIYTLLFSAAISSFIVAFSLVETMKMPMMESSAPKPASTNGAAMKLTIKLLMEGEVADSLNTALIPNAAVARMEPA